MLDAAVVCQGFDSVLPDIEPETALEAHTIEEGFAAADRGPRRGRGRGQRGPGGRWQRTWAGLEFLREKRARKRERRLAARAADFERLATAWNDKMGLRRGDRVDATGKGRRRRCPD